MRIKCWSKKNYNCFLFCYIALIPCNEKLELMDIPKLFRISSGISQEFWMLCMVKFNTVTQNTQICEPQSTAGSPSSDIHSSGSRSVTPLSGGLLNLLSDFRQVWQRCWNLRHSNTWTNADDRRDEKCKTVFPHWKAGSSTSPQRSVTPGQQRAPSLEPGLGH